MADAQSRACARCFASYRSLLHEQRSDIGGTVIVRSTGAAQIKQHRTLVSVRAGQRLANGIAQACVVEVLLGAMRSIVTLLLEELAGREVGLLATS